MMVIMMKMQDGDTGNNHEIIDEGNLLAHDSDTAGISAECRNVSFHPLKTSNLLS